MLKEVEKRNVVGTEDRQHNHQDIHQVLIIMVVDHKVVDLINHHQVSDMAGLESHHHQVDLKCLHLQIFKSNSRMDINQILILINHHQISTPKKLRMDFKIGFLIT